MSIQEVQLPELGEGVTEGEMVRWLVQIGDSVEIDQAVAEMMTDKATVEVPTPFSGKVKELKVKEGDRVPIKSTILVLDVEKNEKKTNEEVKSESLEKTKSGEIKNIEKEALLERNQPYQSFRSPNSTSNHRGGVEKQADEGERILATPHTRRLARELNLDLREVKGTGLAGRILREDVLNQAQKASHLSSKKVETSFQNVGSFFGEESLFPPLSSQKTSSSFLSDFSEREKRVPLRGIRRQISIHMKKSKEHIPHFTLVEEASVSELVRIREEMMKKIKDQNIKLTYLPFIIKALVQTLKEYPIFNASLDEEKEEIIYKNYVNIGIAVSTEEGLIVPNIKNVDQKNVLQIAQEIQILASKARQSKLSLDELKDGTFTLSNMGSIGGLFATPIIYHPEVAILGIYKIEEKLAFSDVGREEAQKGASHFVLKREKRGEEKQKQNQENYFYIKKCMNFSITCDHRLIDGAVAAQFLNSFVSRIENPSLLLLEMI